MRKTVTKFIGARNKKSITSKVALANYIFEHRNCHSNLPEPSAKEIQLYEKEASGQIALHTTLIIQDLHAKPSFWHGVWQSLLGSFLWALLFAIISFIVIVNSPDIRRSLCEILSVESEVAAPNEY